MFSEASSQPSSIESCKNKGVFRLSTTFTVTGRAKIAVVEYCDLFNEHSNVYPYSAKASIQEGKGATNVSIQ